MLLTIGPYQILLLLSPILFGFWIYGFIHLFTRPYSSTTKFFFVLLFVLIFFIGTTVYFLVRDKSVGKTISKIQ